MLVQVEEPESSLLEELCPLPLVRSLGAAWAEHAQITRLGLALGLALPQLIGHLGLLVLPAIVEVVEIVKVVEVLELIVSVLLPLLLLLLLLLLP